jgi:hypothetical protein
MGARSADLKAPSRLALHEDEAQIAHHGHGDPGDGLERGRAVEGGGELPARVAQKGEALLGRDGLFFRLPEP